MCVIVVVVAPVLLCGHAVVVEPWPKPCYVTLCPARNQLVEKEYEDMVHPIKRANLNLHKGPKVLREAQMLYVEENKSEDEKADSKGFTKWVTDGASKLAWV